MQNHKIRQADWEEREKGTKKERGKKKPGWKKHTPQFPTLLEVVHALTCIALPQFLANKTGHHAADPLLADNSVAGIVDGDVVFVVHTLVGRRDGRLFSEEGGGFGGRHFDLLEPLCGSAWFVESIGVGEDGVGGVMGLSRCWCSWS